MTSAWAPSATPAGDLGRPGYDGRTVLLHWLTAALVAAQWLGAHAIDLFPRGALRIDARSLHILIGSLLAGVVAVRLAWRATGGRRLPPADRGALRAAALGVHALLYGLLIATLSLGLLNVLARGDSLFGVLTAPRLAMPAASKRLMGGLHELAANLLLATAAVHSGAAVAHELVLKDRLLGRMIPALRARRRD